MNLQYILSIDGLINGFVAIFFGLLVLYKNYKNKNNQTLFLLTLATAFWCFGYWRWLSIINNETDALFWARILSIGSLFIPVFYFHWIYSLLQLNKKNKYILLISYFLSLFFLLFSFSPLFINRVEPEIFFNYWPKAGILYTIHLIFTYFLLVFYSIILLFKELKKSTGFRKEQIKYVLYGSILGFGGGATNFFLWYDVNILPLGNFLIIVYPAVLSYAIIKHRLMDIKFVMRKSSVYITSLISILFLSFFVRFILNGFVLKKTSWIDLIILIFAISFFPTIRNFYYRLANKYFFSSLCDSQKIISDLSDKLDSTLDIDKIYNFIYETLLDAFHFKFFGILNYDKKENEYLIKYNKGFNLKLNKKIFENEILQKNFIYKNELIITEELIKNDYYNKNAKKTIDLLIKLNINILAPLNIKDKTVGLIILGPKESGDMYNEEDIKVLKTISSFSAMAFENASLYKETLRFNNKLKREINKATKELISANKELKKLDEAKSEFISIASHQLRTPLTVIKGYVSMIIDENFGKVNVKQKDPLNKVFISGERLIQLVENLLNVSRLESGRMQFAYREENIEEIVKSVIDELQCKAKDKNIKLIYNKPKKSLPKIIIDNEKMRQVITNLIDNSIKYTPIGKINVILKKEKNKILFSVSDNGMGIHPEDMSKLFKKFSRGKGVSTVHTEGTGLGLYVARKMIEAHNGKIWVESKGEGKGAKFSFELPVNFKK